MKTRNLKYPRSSGMNGDKSGESGAFLFSAWRRGNRNAPDSPDLSPFIPDDRGYLRFRVFITRQNLGRSGNCKIPDRLGFSLHMKIRLSRRVPNFCDGRRSFPTNKNSNLYRSGHRHPLAMDFAHYQSPKLLGSSPPITNK